MANLEFTSYNILRKAKVRLFYSYWPFFPYVLHLVTAFPHGQPLVTGHKNFWFSYETGCVDRSRTSTHEWYVDGERTGQTSAKARGEGAEKARAEIETEAVTAAKARKESR